MFYKCLSLFVREEHCYPGAFRRQVFLTYGLITFNSFSAFRAFALSLDSRATASAFVVHSFNFLFCYQELAATVKEAVSQPNLSLLAAWLHQALLQCVELKLNALALQRSQLQFFGSCWQRAIGEEHWIAFRFSVLLQ